MRKQTNSHHKLVIISGRPSQQTGSNNMMSSTFDLIMSAQPKADVSYLLFILNCSHHMQACQHGTTVYYNSFGQFIVTFNTLHLSHKQLILDRLPLPYGPDSGPPPNRRPRTT